MRDIELKEGMPLDEILELLRDSKMERITLRIDQFVVDWFKETYPKGWQTEIRIFLEAYVALHKKGFEIVVK